MINFYVSWFFIVFNIVALTGSIMSCSTASSTV